MKKSEYKLVVTLFAYQQRQVETLIEVLKNREAITVDDLRAFLVAAQLDALSQGESFRESEEICRSVAERLGLNLENL